MDKVIANLEALAKEPKDRNRGGKPKTAPTRSKAMAAAWDGEKLKEDRG